MKVLKPPQSGSHDGLTASRNRFGQYERTRAVPVNPASSSQGTVRNRLSLNSQAWRLLTDAQRAGWAALGLQLTRTDALGQTYTLQGNQAYAAINNALHAAGGAILSDAPVISAPVDLLTATVTTTGGTLSLAYTATPLAASTYLFIYASPQRSAGRNYESDLRLITVTAAAAASPANILAAYTAKFGAPVVGNKIFFSLRTMIGGFMGGPFRLSKVVTA